MDFKAVPNAQRDSAAIDASLVSPEALAVPEAVGNRPLTLGGHRSLAALERYLDQDAARVKAEAARSLLVG